MTWSWGTSNVGWVTGLWFGFGGLGADVYHWVSLLIVGFVP